MKENAFLKEFVNVEIDTHKTETTQQTADNTFKTNVLKDNTNKEINKQSPVILEKKAFASEFDIILKDNYRNAYIATEGMKKDTVKLGSKTWKPNEAQKEKNERIKKAKNISKNATGYTLMISTDIKEILNSHENHSEEFTTAEDMAEDYMRTLSSVSLTAKMFSGSYLAKHFKDIFNVVDTYKRLKELVEENGYEVLGDLGEEFASMEESFDLLSKRLREFAANNHVDLTTGEGFDKKLKDQDKISDDDLRAWILKTDESKYERKKTRLAEKLNTFFTEMLEDEDFENVQDNVRKFDYKEIMTPASSYPDMSIKDRIRKLPIIRGHVEAIKTKLSQTSLPEKVRTELRKELTEMNAIKRLAEAEYVIQQAMDQEEINDINELNQKYPDEVMELFEASENIRKIKKRFNNPAGIVDTRTLPKGIHKVSRQEALSTPSDLLSMNKRTTILRFSENLLNPDNNLSAEDMADAKQLNTLIRKYFDNNFYKVGDRVESQSMKAVTDFIRAKELDKKPAFAKFVKFINNSVTGSLKVDPNNLPPDAEYIDKTIGGTDKTRPKTVDAGKQDWWVKAVEGTLKTFTKWEDRRDDPLFAHEPTVNDLRQGKVSNCWMVAGTETVINYDPQIIKDCMKDNGDGTVTVRLYTYKEDKQTGASFPAPTFIRVKKETPKLITGGAVHTSGALWMQILEKAAAFIGYKEPKVQDTKLGYNALWHGAAADWIFALTGIDQQNILLADATGGNTLHGNLKFKDSLIDGYTINEDEKSQPYENEQFKNELFEDLRTARERGYIYTYGSKKGSAPGMNTGHAYIVMGAREINGERYVRLRNPYGNMTGEYDEHGKLSRTDSYMNSQMDETCGQFDIKLEDFIKNSSGMSRINMNQPIKSKEECIAEHQKKMESNAKVTIIDTPKDDF